MANVPMIALTVTLVGLAIQVVCSTVLMFGTIVLLNRMLVVVKSYGFHKGLSGGILRMPQTLTDFLFGIKYLGKPKYYFSRKEIL